MIRHLSFFEILGSLEPDSPSWSRTLAGLAVLNLVDAAREDGSVIDLDWLGVQAVTNSVMALREGDPVRRPLIEAVDALRGAGPDWSRISRHLFAYGRALDLDGDWKLAVDVFGTVSEMARAEREPQLAIEATTALGGAARRSGDWDKSAEGYAEAAHMADAMGDKASGLTVRVGTANTQMVRGNLPAAQNILDEVIAEAEKSQLDGVAALAYHASASVAHLRGDFGRTVTLAHIALEKATNPSVRDSIVADIAAAFQELGMRDAARDAHLVISLTSRYQWVRWQATLNLMELASLDSMAGPFEEYARQLRHAALDPRLRSYFLLYYGEGCQRFGREEEGRRSIEEARTFAARHKIHQVVFDADAALASERERIAPERSIPASSAGAVPEEVLQIAREFTHLRDEALAAPFSESLV